MPIHRLCMNIVLAIKHVRYKPDPLVMILLRNMCFLIQYLHKPRSLLHAGLLTNTKEAGVDQSLSSAGVFEGWDCLEYSQHVCLVVLLSIALNCRCLMNAT